MKIFQNGLMLLGCFLLVFLGLPNLIWGEKVAESGTLGAEALGFCAVWALAMAVLVFFLSFGLGRLIGYQGDKIRGRGAKWPLGGLPVENSH